MHTEEIQNITRQEGNLHDFLSYQIKLNTIPSILVVLYCMVPLRSSESFRPIIFTFAIASGKIIRN